jgi:hypothetical protein
LAKKTHGPFFVTGKEVDTFIDVNEGDIIQTISNKGTVFFSLAGPELNVNLSLIKHSFTGTQQ